MPNATLDDIVAQICEYLRLNVERPLPASLGATTRYVTDLHLDSMEGAQMLSELEDHYGVTLSVSIFQRTQTLGDIAAVVASALESGKSV